MTAIRLYAEALAKAEERVRALGMVNAVNAGLRLDVDMKLAQEALNRAQRAYTEALQITTIEEIEAALAESSPPPDTRG